jgi:hypothetical protein
VKGRVDDVYSIQLVTIRIGTGMDIDRIFAGVDISGGPKRLTLAILAGDGRVEILRALAVSAVVERLAGAPKASVALGGPLRARPASDAGGPADSGLAGAFRRKRLDNARAAEAELVRHGIPVRLTPAVEGAAPAWMRGAFQLARALAAAGFAEGRDADRWLIETNPLACFTVLLGRLPFGRDSLEGRLQRQLALIRERVALPDPMDALEEVTAHHLLAGQLRLDGIGRADALDAVAAAVTAWRAWKSPAEVCWLGRDEDGWLCLPVREMADNYRRPPEIE